MPDPRTIAQGHPCAQHQRAGVGTNILLALNEKVFSKGTHQMCPPCIVSVTCLGTRRLDEQDGLMSELRGPTEQPSGATSGELLKVEGLARLLQVSEAWVRKGILKRTLPFTKIGRNVRFTPAQVRQIIQAGERPLGRAAGAQSGRGSARTRL